MVGHSRHSWLLHARISRCIRDALNLHGLRRSPRFGFNSLPFIWKYMRLRYRHDKITSFPILMMAMIGSPTKNGCREKDSKRLWIPWKVSWWVVTPSTGFFHWAANTLTGVPNFWNRWKMRLVLSASVGINYFIMIYLFFYFILVLCIVNKVDAVMDWAKIPPKSLSSTWVHFAQRLVDG